MDCIIFNFFIKQLFYFKIYENNVITHMLIREVPEQIFLFYQVKLKINDMIHIM